jgi:Domain of unknown function (DUF4129)
MGEDQALERLRDILARPEYQVEQATPWWAQPFAPLRDLLGYLVARFIQMLVDATAGRDGPIGLVVLAACVLAGVVAGVYLIRAVRLSVTRESRIGSANLAERRERSERLWQTAQQLAAAGQFAEAVRVVYLSALYALDERALLHVETSLTNREHARLLSQLHPSIGQAFADVVQQYDRLRYGRFEVTRSTFADLSELVARARSASLHGSRP